MKDYWYSWRRFLEDSLRRKPTPPTVWDTFIRMLRNIWLSVKPLFGYILFTIIFRLLLEVLLDFIATRNLNQKIVQAHEDLKFHWKDIHIDEEIKKLLQDNVTRPLVIRKSSPNALSKDASLPKGLLFSGPSGTGKTLLAMIVAKESKCNFLSIDASDIKDMWYGGSEKKVRGIFKIARKYQPCILFIDEIDTLLSARNEHNHSVDNSIKGLFLTNWDGMYSKSKGKSYSVILIGATNRPKSLDPAFLRRLDLNIEIPLPNVKQKEKILEIILKDSLLEDGFNIKNIAEKATGFTGADLAEAVRYAIMNCNADYHKTLEHDIDTINKKQNEMSFASLWPFRSFTIFKECGMCSPKSGPLKIPITNISMEDSIAHSKKSRSSGGGVGGLDSTELLIASNLIHPHDIDTTWADIAGCSDIIQDIKNNLILPMKVQMSDKFKLSKFLTCPKGILLHGPPGSGKTLLAKAVARHSGCSFINLQPSMLESKWYGETSERTAALFRVAEKYQPCIIFIDEIDAYLRDRRDSDSEVSAGKKAQFLSLLDGILTDPKKLIILMGATNRIDNLDRALLRRLTLKFSINIPDRNKRLEIIQLLLKDEKLSYDISFERLVDATEDMTGADLKEVVRAAIIEALKESHADLLQDDADTQLPTTTKEEEVDFRISDISFSNPDLTETDTDNNNTEKIQTDCNSNENLPFDDSLKSESADSIMPDSEEPLIQIQLKMNHFVVAIENFKKSKVGGTDAPWNMYC